MVGIIDVTMLASEFSDMKRGCYALLTACRFSDRDIFMRYLWGLGVGHLHTHQSESSVVQNTGENAEADGEQNTHSCEYGTEEMQNPLQNSFDAQSQDRNSEEYDSENPELILEDPSTCDEWHDDESDDANDCGDEDMDGEDFAGMWCR